MATKLKADTAKAADFADAKSKVDPPSLTDTGNGIRFARRHGNNVRFIVEYVRWAIWDNQRWRLDDNFGIMRLAKQIPREIAVETLDAPTPAAAAAIGKHARQSESRRALDAMLSLARSEPGIAISQDALDADPMLLGVENGKVDLRTGKLQKASREDLMTKQANTAFDPAATCPIWEGFLNKIANSDQELIGCLQRFVGYCLTGDTSEHMLAFFHGTGANGKSTFLVTLRNLLGDYFRQSPGETLLARREGGINNDIARLCGARVVACVETEDGKRMAEALVKQLTGGDPITARYLHQEYFEFVPGFKIILAANHLPIISGADHGMWRRIYMFPFLVTIPLEERDKALPDKLRAELPGILAWAVRGCLEWQRIGLSPPPAVLLATQHYREEMDLIGQWIDERCVLAVSAKVQASKAHDNYKKWIEARGAKAMSQMTFSRKLEDRGYKRIKSGVVNFWGIGLAAEDGEVGCLELDSGGFE